MEAVNCQGVQHYTCLSTHLCVHSDAHDSLIWFQASGFCYTINTGSLLGLLIGHPVAAQCHREPVVSDLSDCSFYVLQQFIDGVDIRVGQLKALDLGLDDS